MAKVRSQEPVLPSLLDRLIDDDPGYSVESVKPASVLLNELRANIRRDLENLLNTRLFRQDDLSDYPELATSVISYGLPDFSTVLMGSPQHREEFRQTIQDAIERFETRFRKVQVEIVDAGEEYERTLYLKISAMLMVEPDPIPLLFDSRIHAVDRMVKLREVDHG